MDLLTLSTCLVGVLILTRSGGRRTPLLLGLALVCFGMIDSKPQMWEEAPSILPVFAAVNTTDYLSIFVLMAAFSIAFVSETGKVRLGPLKYLFAAYALAFYAVGYWRTCENWAGLPGFSTAASVLEVMTYPLYGACLWFMYLGWKRSGRAERARHTLALVAFALLVLAQILTEFVFWGLGANNYMTNPVELVAATVAGVLAPALLAYAILRHKVFDLGFALNRTLVYGAVSAILLAAFGLIEWAVDHLIPIEGRENNAVVDAAIAVAVFLMFHRVRDAVETAVESVFFRRWRAAEQTLRRFVREAAFITEAPDLCNALAAALTQYSEGAEAAIYLAGLRGYTRVAGAVTNLPSTLEPNRSELVRVRAELRPHVNAEAETGAAVVAPIVNRNEMVGFAVLGPKPEADGYRPDEIELLGWATRQVGLDLHALKVETLEREVLLLNARLEGALAATLRA